MTITYVQSFKVKPCLKGLLHFKEVLLKYLLPRHVLSNHLSSELDPSSLLGSYEPPDKDRDHDNTKHIRKQGLCSVHWILKM